MFTMQCLISVTAYSTLTNERVISYLPSDVAEPADVVAPIRERRGKDGLLKLDRILLHSPPMGTFDLTITLCRVVAFTHLQHLGGIQCLVLFVLASIWMVSCES